MRGVTARNQSESGCAAHSKETGMTRARIVTRTANQHSNILDQIELSVQSGTWTMTVVNMGRLSENWEKPVKSAARPHRTEAADITRPIRRRRTLIEANEQHTGTTAP
jgi:hypothetical protein